ncbi:MAG: response regulator [Elusimicrobiota bacterium]
MQEEGLPRLPEFADPRQKLILIVDDDESLLDLLEHMVKREGFRCERASDGQEALRKVEERTPDLIVLDFMLPGIGGYEVVKELQMGEARGVPVVIITGRRIDRQTADMIREESNVIDFVEKPVRPAVFGPGLHRILKTRPPEACRTAVRGPLASSW